MISGAGVPRQGERLGSVVMIWGRPDMTRMAQHLSIAQLEARVRGSSDVVAEPLPGDLAVGEGAYAFGSCRSDGAHTALDQQAGTPLLAV